MTKKEMKSILSENNRRKKKLETRYDQLTGEGCCGKRKKITDKWGHETVRLPVEMLKDPSFSLKMSKKAYEQLRYKYDFEYWCVRQAKIKHKVSRRIEPFVLNGPQRLLVAELERQRVAGVPVRLILLKARQWGGSTLLLVYMAWWQLVLFEHCNAAICSHLKDTSATILGMYKQLLEGMEG